MHKLTFLKLEGLRGLSFAPRHIGDFEITPYYTFGDETLVGRKTNGYASRWTHLRVYKRNDTDNVQLRLAWTKEQIYVLPLSRERTRASHGLLGRRRLDAAQSRRTFRLGQVLDQPFDIFLIVVKVRGYS